MSGFFAYLIERENMIASLSRSYQANNYVPDIPRAAIRKRMLGAPALTNMSL